MMDDVTEVVAIDPANVDSAMADEELIDEESEEGLAWWIYLILVLVNIGVIGAGVWWFMLRKPNEAVDAKTSVEAEGAMADLEALEEDFAGDFDSLDDGDDEEEISFSADAAENETGSATGDSSFDEDFSIDPDDDVDTDDESWGEFDSDSSLGGEAKGDETKE